MSHRFPDTTARDKIANNFLLSLAILLIASLFINDMLYRAHFLVTREESPIVSLPGNIPLVVPGTSSEPGTAGALGSDFSQVYFSAKAIRHGESAYNPLSHQFRLPIGGRPNYPPLTNFLYQPLTLFPYHVALLIHSYSSILLFCTVTAFVLNLFGLKRYIWKDIGIFLLFYFYTPTGFFHFERGQFDLYVAASYLLAFTAAIYNTCSPANAFMSGFLGSLKWSSVPFLGTFSGVAFLASAERRRWIMFLIPAAMALSVLLLFAEVKEYLPSMQMYEFSASNPMGATFIKIMPRYIAKTVQLFSALFICVLLLFLIDKKLRQEVFLSISFPFALAMGLQSICFPTISYEYRHVALLALVPLFIIWVHKAEGINERKFTLISNSFALLLMVLFHVTSIIELSVQLLRLIIPVTDDKMFTWLYLLVSLLLLSFCAMIIHEKRDDTESVTALDT